MKALMRGLRNAILGCVILISIQANGQNSFDWVAQFESSNGDNTFNNDPIVSRAMITDKDGNIYIGGIFYDTADFNPGKGNMTLISKGLNDMFLLKLNEYGEPLWVNQIGGAGIDYLESISIRNNELFVSSEFSGKVDFDPGPDSSFHYGNGYRAAAFSIFKPNGTLASTVKIDGPSYVSIWDHTTDPFGNHYLLGNFREVADFDPGTLSYPKASNGYFDVFVLKLDAYLRFKWVKTFGGTSGDFGRKIELDSKGDIYVSGTFNDRVDFDPGIDTFYLGTPRSQNRFILKLDSNGNFIRAQEFWQYGNNVYDLALDKEDNLYFSNYPSYLIKYDPSGNDVWSIKQNATIEDIHIDGENIYTTGSFYGTQDFDPDTSEMMLKSYGLYDVFIAKYSIDGNLIGAKNLGGKRYDQGMNICVDAFDNLYVDGNFEDTADFDPGPQEHKLISSGPKDMFLLKMSKYMVAVPEITALNSEINIYPNPTNGSVRIDLGFHTESLNLVIRNSIGQIIERQTHTSKSSIQTEIKGEPGLYFIELIFTDGDRLVSKVVKN